MGIYKTLFALFATVFTFISGFGADAQTRANASGGTLLGSVVDSSRKPIPSAEITILGIERSTRSDSSGLFVFHDIPFGSYRVEAKRLGYQPHARGVTITDVNGSRVEFVLPAAPQFLDPTSVTARRDILPPGAPQRLFDFYRRRKTGTGTYITRDDIERAGSVRATLGGVSGIRLFTAPGGQVRGIKFIRCSGTIRSGESPVAYFLDGIQTTDAVFSFLSDADIEALEIYKGPASMPAEAAGSGCAAVFIWTRR